jgi:hypothetical protein
MKIHIEYQNQFGKWMHYQTINHEANAYRTGKTRAKQTGKRYRLVNDAGSLLDLIEPD